MRAWFPERLSGGLAALACAAALTACTSGGAEHTPTAESTPVAVSQAAAVSPDQLPGWDADDPRPALVALARSCTRLRTLKASEPYGTGPMARPAGSWQRVCAAVPPNPTREDARQWLVQHFEAIPAAERAHFTGYYEPELRGVRPAERAANAALAREYAVPLHRRPDDLVLVDTPAYTRAGIAMPDRMAGTLNAEGKLVPYPDRASLTGADSPLTGRGLELLWLDDPVDAFFLHIQGSGRVRLNDGSTMRVGYDGRNGHPYHAIGKTLLERGALQAGDVTAQSIRAWLRANPKEQAAVFNTNPAYIFFRELKDIAPEDGPVGSQAVALTTGRSVAVDPAHIPLGAPVWISTPLPAVDGYPAAHWQRLTIAQDTGSAIRHADAATARLDVFMGAGPEAEAYAGALNHRGDAYVLLPRPAPVRP